MKFMCISPANEDEPPEESNHHSSKLWIWYNSIRRGLKRDNKEPRKIISEPIPIETLTQSDLIQMNGVIEVKPSVDDTEQSSSVKSAGEVITDKRPKNDGTNNNNDGAEAVIEYSPNFKDGTNVNNIYSNNITTQHITSTTPVTNVDAAADTTDSLAKVDQETDQQIISYVWFWGSISRREAENLLRSKKDGSFLVRVSSDKRFLYSLSFRSNGKTMHTRIEHSNGLFFFYSNEANSNRTNEGNATLGGLISVAMNQNNADSIFFYSRGLRSEQSSLHTVSLNQPLSRYQYLLDYNYDHDENKSLQYMCKFVIHHSSSIKLQQLQTLPLKIRNFAENSHYFPTRKNN